MASKSDDPTASAELSDVTGLLLTQFNEEMEILKEDHVSARTKKP